MTSVKETGLKRHLVMKIGHYLLAPGPSMWDYHECILYASKPVGFDAHPGFSTFASADEKSLSLKRQLSLQLLFLHHSKSKEFWWVLLALNFLVSWQVPSPKIPQIWKPHLSRTLLIAFLSVVQLDLDWVYSCADCHIWLMMHHCLPKGNLNRSWGNHLGFLLLRNISLLALWKSSLF